MGIFDDLVDSIQQVSESVVNVASLDADSRDVATLIAAGLSAAAIAEITGVSVSVIEGLMDDD